MYLLLMIFSSIFFLFQLLQEEEELTEIAFAKLTQTPDLANTEAPEDEKIKAMIKQSTDVFNPSQYVNVRRAPPNYQCYRCNGKGHFLKDCPTQGDSRYNNNSQYHRVPSGIPRAYFLLRMKQEEQLLSKLRAMQPENSRFSPVVGSDVVDQTKIPSELQCPMCKKLFTDVVVTPCCGFSYCDECIRNYLVEHDLVCVCKETTSPDNLIANKSLRISVSNFRNQKKSEMKSVPPSPVSIVPPPHSVSGGVGAPCIKSEDVSVPSVGIEQPIIQVQPPDLHSDTSQSSLTNGLLGMESGADSDSLVENSPKKILLETQHENSSSPLNVTNGNAQPPVVSQQVVLPTSNAQAVTSLPASQPSLISGSLASQVVPHQFSGPAIYSNVPSSIRPGLILPQQQQRHMVPHQAVVAPAHPFGINIPPGATIVKRLVPVPVGPRLAPNQIRLAQAQAQAHMMATSGMNPHLVEPIRARGDLVKANEKHRGTEAASPMPLTEDEFYLCQQQFKKRTTTTSSRRRHRSTSHDGSRERERREGSRERERKEEPRERERHDGSRERERRDGSRERERRDGSRERERFRSASGSASRSRSRSRTPPADKKRHFRSKEGEVVSSPTHPKKKYDSADDSSQERKRKEVKMKRKHRETSQGSGKGSDSGKPRSRGVEKKGKTRELPEHIKREIDEFEFDNELEFDEELRNLRKTKQKRKLDDAQLSSPEGSTSPKISDVKGVVKDDDIDLVLHSPEYKSPIKEDKASPNRHDKRDEDDKSPTMEKDGNAKALDTVPPGNNEEKPSTTVDDVNMQDEKASSELTSPTTVAGGDNVAKATDGKPKKKTKIIKKMVVRRVKVTRKKQKVPTTGVQPASTPETPPGEVVTSPIDAPKAELAESVKTPEISSMPSETCNITSETSNILNESLATPEMPKTPETITSEIPDAVIVPDEADMSIIEIKENEPSKSENDNSVLEIHPQPEAEDPLLFDGVVITDQPLPENSRWETSGKVRSSSHHSKVSDLVRSSSSPKNIRSSSSPKKPKTLNIDSSSSPKKPKTLNIDSLDPKVEKKKSRKEGLEKPVEKSDAAKAMRNSSEKCDAARATKGVNDDVTKVKSAVAKDKLLAIKQMHANKTKIISEVRAKKEAEKRALIEKGKRIASEKTKSDVKEAGAAVDDEERRRRREKYMLLKKQRAKERALAERQKAKKLESDGEVVKTKGEVVKTKGKVKRSDVDHSDHSVIDERKCEQGVNYKPADAKLKSISEITKKRLKQGDGACEVKKNEELEDEASDVLKSKVTSIKTVIAAAEKRRVIKTSVSEERELTAAVFPEDLHVRRVIKVDDNRKKSLVSKVEKLATATDKSITIRGDHEKRRHREDERERERDDAMDRDRYERRVRLREEENLRREVKDKIRLREMEKEMREKEELKVKSLEKEKLEGLERERLAIKEKEKLERKLKRERQLREDMIREKEEKDETDNKKKKDDGDKRRQDKRKVTIGNNSDSGNNSDEHKNSKRTKKEKAKPGYIIQIIDSDKSDSDSDSTDIDDREKKKKKKNKRRKEKKKKKKKSDDNKSEEKEESEESSDEETTDEKKKKKRKKESEASSEEDEEDRKKKKRKKHKKKHKKHRRVKKTKKKSKKKKPRKEKEDSESESEEGKQAQQSGEDSGEEESGTESAKEAKSSSSSDGESGASSSSEKKKEGGGGNNSVKTDVVPDVAHVCTVQGRTNSKETVESRSTGKSKSPQSKNDNTGKEASLPLVSHRDTSSKEKSDIPKSQSVPSRESSESVRSERERDAAARNRSKRETGKTEHRESRSKDKSNTSRNESDIQIVEKSIETKTEPEAKEKVTSKERHLKRESRSKTKSEVVRPDRDVKKTEDRRSDRNKELLTDRNERTKDSKDERSVASSSPAHVRRNETATSDDLELDYNDEGLGDLEDDVLYGDLDFADDEQTNPSASEDNKLRTKKKSDDFEDGEILDEDLFAASRKDSKSSKSKSFEIDDSTTGTDTETEETDMRTDNLAINECDTNIMKSNDIETAIENAVDNAINELSLEIEDDGSESPPAKVKRTKSTETLDTPKRVLRKR